jgi:hypothetical protein
MKLKTLATTALTALSIATAADAANQRVLYRGPAWETLILETNDTHVPMCSMHVHGSDRNMYVKYVADGDGKLFIQLFKTSWRFPKDGVTLPLVLGFDKNPMVNVEEASGFSDGTVNGVTFYVKGDLAAGFLHEFGEANEMFVQFKAGNEQPWVANMNGSRAAMQAFSSCVTAIDQNKPTQPYATSKATQPYAQPTEPAQPAAPTKPKTFSSSPVTP